MLNKNWISTLLFILVKVHSLTGNCVLSSAESVECISVEEEEMMSFINERRLYALKVENSSIYQIEMFPCSLKMVTITNSKVKRFFPVDMYGVRLVDLSFNEISEVNILYMHAYLEKLLLHHNRIEFFDGYRLCPRFSDSYIRVLDLSYNSIKNFTNLECTRLRSLNLSHNLIENLTNLLVGLVNIETLDLSYNKLKNFKGDEIDNLNNLRILNLSHNDIKLFQYTKKPTLTCRFSMQDDSFLDLSYNRLNLSRGLFDNYNCYRQQTISFENNDLKNLDFLFSNKSESFLGKSITFRNNKITKLLPYNFRGFILKKLDLSLNEIESIFPLTFGSAKVEELLLHQNKITSINSQSFIELSNLVRLNISFNPLSTIDEFSLKNISKSLRVLDLSHCLLEKIPVGLFNETHLSEIYLSHNRIEVIEPHSFPSLRILDLSNNKIKNLPGNVFSGLKISVSLRLSHNPLVYIEGAFNNTEIRNISLNGISLAKLTDKDVRGLENLRYLDLSNNNIRELTNNTFDKFSSLTSLILDNNLIRTIPANFCGMNPAFRVLSFIGNPISSISIDAFPHKMKLTYLLLTLFGKLEKKRFSNLMFLGHLHIVNSTLTEIEKGSFEGLINLNTLSFENTTVLDLKSGAFNGLDKVENFHVRSLLANITTLKSEVFLGLKSLKFSNFSSIGLEVIEDRAFYGLESLLDLTLSHNKIGDLPRNAFVGLKKLKMLNLSFNNLTGKQSTFPIGIFKDLVELTHLHLQHNRIIKFHIGEFSNLENLRFLNLSHNQLSYLDRHLLFPLRKLEVLDINSNHVIKFDYHFTLKHLSSLNIIGIGENKWPCENLTIMLNDFEQRGVNYREISKLQFDVENIGGIYCVYVCNYLYCPKEDDLVVTY